MKLMFVLMALLAVANAHNYEMWMKKKAMRACFGEEEWNLWTAKSKIAMQKCSGLESPELDFPMFKDPARMINALMMGAKESEKAKLMKFVRMAAGNQKLTHPFAAPAQTMTLVPYPMLSMPQRQHSREDNLMMKMMQVMMMERMMNKLAGGDTTFFEGMAEDDENEIMRSSFDMQADFENILEALFKTRYGLRRHKRATDADLLDKGEKMVEKLMLEQEKIKMKIGNKTCYLQEMGMIDSDRNLDLDQMVRNSEQSLIKDDWLKKEKTKAIRMCYATVDSLPREVLDESSIYEKWYKIKAFLECLEKRKVKACLVRDVRQKLETEFGAIEKLEDDTGMDEKTLLLLAQKIFSGDKAM